MQRVGKILFWGLVAGVLVLGAGLFALQRWISTDHFRELAQARAGAALGKQVSLGALQVDVWPLPAVAALRVEIATKPVLRLERVEVRPVLAGLLAGRLELSTLLVRRADVAQAAVDDLLNSMPRKQAGGPGAADPGSEAAVPILARRLVLDSVTWRSAGGAATTIDADARLASDGLPDAVKLKVLAGQQKDATVRIQRSATGWDVDIGVAGGTVRGVVQQMADGAGKPVVGLKGQLDTRNVELGLLLRRQSGGADDKSSAASPMRGKLVATTTFSAQARDLAGLVDALSTQSQFTVQDAVVQGIDLARAVKTVGMNRGGETRLDTLTGQVQTRGRAIQLRNLAASSGALSAHGNVAIAVNRSLSGRVNVNLGAQVVGSAVGVPLVVGGTLDAPEVTLTRSALVGAAIGTLVMPGVGTGAGAAVGDKIGDKLKGFFGK